jgi:O-antigen ligase
MNHNLRSSSLVAHHHRVFGRAGSAWVGVIAGVGFGLIVIQAGTSSVVAAAGAVAIWPLLADPFRALVFYLAFGTLVPHMFSVTVLTVTLFSARFAFLVLAAALLWRCWQSPPSSRIAATPLNGYLVAFVAVMLLSLAVNLSGFTTEQTLAALRVCFYFLADYVLLFTAAVIALRLKGQRSIEPMLGALIAVMAAAALIGIAEHVSGRNVYEIVRAYAPQLISEQGEAWGEYLTTYRSRGALLRSSSTFSHFLDFGAALIMVIPIAVHFVSHARGARWRALAFAALALLLTALIFTFSRGAYLALLLGAVTYLLLARNIRAVGAALMLLTMGLLLLLVIPGPLETMTEAFFPSEGYTREGSIRARLEDYAPMAEIVRENPVVGLGPGMLLRQGFVQEYPHLRQLEALDNYYLIVIGELGVLGLVAFLALLGCVCRSVWWPRMSSIEGRSLQAALMAACVSFLFLNATFDAMVFSAARLFWIIVAAAVVLNEATRPARAYSAPAR